MMWYNRNLKSDEWITRSGKLRNILENKFEVLHRTIHNESVRSALNFYRVRVIEKEVKTALGKWFSFDVVFFLNFWIAQAVQLKLHFSTVNSISTLKHFLSTEFTASRMLAVSRNWKNKQAPTDVERIKNLLKEKLPNDNHSTLEWVFFHVLSGAFAYYVTQKREMEKA